MVQPLWKMVWKFLKKFKTELPYDTAISLLGIYLKKTKTLTQKGICTPMFTAAKLTIAKIWKQPKCSSMDEWIKMCEMYVCVCVCVCIHTHTHIYIYKMEYISAIKKDILPFRTT